MIEVAHQITRDFKGERVHLVGVLKGACIFLSDLVREIGLDTSIDFMAVSSYGKQKESSGQVRVLKDLESSIEGLNVIVVEDILDTGLTSAICFACCNSGARNPCASPRCSISLRGESNRCRAIMWASRFRTSSWWATGWITLSATGI